MSGRGIYIFKIKDIEIFLDYSWLIVFFLLVFLFSYYYFPAALHNKGNIYYFSLGLITSLLFFLSSFIHELMHSIVAQKINLPVKRITLFLFGGMSEIFEEPKSAEAEFKMAIAGPATSLAIAIFFGILWGILDRFFNYPAAVAVFSTLFEANLILTIFNLLPGFPLDGGRIMRSIIWATSHDYKKATKFATGGGQVLAMFLIFFGILEIVISGFWGGFWLILIGLFLNQAAGQSFLELSIKESLKDVAVNDLMSQKIVTLSPNLSLDLVMTEYFIKYLAQSFPVVEDEQVIGIVSIDEIRKKSQNLTEFSRVKDVMVGYPPDLNVSQNTKSVSALKLMVEQNVSFLPVKKDGKLVGMITLDSIANYLSAQGVI